MARAGIVTASVDVAAASGDGNSTMPNQQGRTIDDAWSVSAEGYWQPFDHLLVSVGGTAYEGNATPAGTLVSLGFSKAQLDIGYRKHWFSPSPESSLLMSTEAEALPSVTLSNYEPLTRFGIRYEMFLAQMDYSDKIAWSTTGTVGYPKLAGMHVSIEPAIGWSLAANRLMQFGGGERNRDSLKDFAHALFDPGRYDNRNAALTQDQEFGNQVAAWTSTFLFPGKTPFAAYLTYAGEDRSYEGNYRLGNSALSIGIQFPSLWNRFDLTYEATEWQNGWYVNSLYGDGLTQDGRVLGHWGADQRVFGDAVGAQAHTLRVGWQPAFGGLAQLIARTVANEGYSSYPYERGYDLALSYSRGLRGLTAGAELRAGKDVFGESYARIDGFMRLGDDWQSGGIGGGGDYKREHGAELFVDAGVNASNVLIRLGDGSDKRSTSTQVAPHIGLGARRQVSSNSDLGVRLELDRVEDNTLLAVRALDYRYRFDSPLALSVFVGAARYDLATPAYGYYLGAGFQWRNLFKHVDVGVDYRYADKVARDKLLPSDPATEPRPDEFFDISGTAFSITYRF
jgi:hypothetical protein